MNAWDAARGIETQGMQVLLPYLQERADGLVLLGGGTLGRWLQRHAGDLMFMEPSGTYSVEVKVESAWTGNAYLETFSNRNLEDRRNHGDHGTRVGWLYTLRADVLLCYYLDRDLLCALDFFALQRWAFGTGDKAGRLHMHREVCQHKRAQRNDTWGRIVPYSVLRDELPQGALLHTRVIQREIATGARGLMPTTTREGIPA